MRDPQRSYYRRNDSSTALSFTPPNQTTTYTVGPGDWIRADLTVGADRGVLRRLGAPMKAGHVPAPWRTAARAEQDVLGSVRGEERPAAGAHGLLVVAPTGARVDAPAAFDRVDVADRAELLAALRDGLNRYPVVAVVDGDTDAVWFDRPVAGVTDGPVEAGLYTHPFNIARRVAVVVALSGDMGLARRCTWALDSLSQHVPVVIVGPPALADVIDGAPAAAAITNDGELHEIVTAGLKAAFELDVDAVAVVVDDALVARGWLDGLDRARRKTGAGIVVPLSNRSGPMSIPLAGEPAPWPTPRMPARHAAEIADALRFTIPKHPIAAPPGGACYMLDRAAWGRIGYIPAGGIGAAWDRALGVKAVIADDVFVWRERDEPAFDGRGQLAATAPIRAAWQHRVERYRSAVQTTKPTGLPVQLLAVDLGKWGGSFCTLRLAQELRRFGIAAQVGRLREASGVERFPFGTVHHEREQSLPATFAASSGWSRGVLVATHWSTGRLVRRVVAANPGVVPAAFWQDREDRFVNPKNPAHVFPAVQAREYVSIPHRVVNAGWQIETARDDFGELGGDVEHIPVGVDAALFSPALQREPGPLRIVAMYRPQTPRRGAARLLGTFARLRQRFGDRISLEVFGWSDGLPPWVVSHGFLEQRGVAELLRRADIVVEPSTFQGFGLVGLEAMACGTALVSTDTMGVWSYATVDDALIVGRPGECSEDELAAAVGALVEDDERRRRLGEAGRRTARRLDWGAIGARWALWLAWLWREHGTDRQLDSAADRAATAAAEFLMRYDAVCSEGAW